MVLKQDALHLFDFVEDSYSIQISRSPRFAVSDCLVYWVGVFLALGSGGAYAVSVARLPNFATPKFCKVEANERTTVSSDIKTSKANANVIPFLHGAIEVPSHLFLYGALEVSSDL